nr:hypothetical protein Iba_chr03bCG1620 [Ipomoea batatas]
MLLFCAFGCFFVGLLSALPTVYFFFVLRFPGLPLLSAGCVGFLSSLLLLFSVSRFLGCKANAFFFLGPPLAGFAAVPPKSVESRWHSGQKLQIDPAVLRSEGPLPVLSTLPTSCPSPSATAAVELNCRPAQPRVYCFPFRFLSLFYTSSRLNDPFVLLWRQQDQVVRPCWCILSPEEVFILLRSATTSHSLGRRSENASDSATGSINTVLPEMIGHPRTLERHSGVSATSASQRLRRRLVRGQISDEDHELLALMINCYYAGLISNPTQPAGSCVA